MRKFFAVLFFAALFVDILVPLKAASDITVIRTFVNGVPDTEVHDLHIEYTNPISGVVTLGQSRGTPSIDPGNPKKVNVVFDPKLGPGESVSIAATTTAGGLSITKWWWTDAAGQKVSRTIRYTDRRGREREGRVSEYGPTERGDEATLPVDPARRGEDVYTILNKAHHWGGEARKTARTELKMDARRLLDRRPAGMDRDGLIRNIEAAIRQWVACTNLDRSDDPPKAGLNGNPVNHGAGRDPAVMAPGETHQGAEGRKFRSLTDRECAAAYFKYPAGLSIDLITDPADATQGDISADWRIPRGYGNPKGVGIPTAPAGEPDRTTGGYIGMRPQGGGTSWHLGEDTDGDGFITNKDTDTVPADHLDFYSIFKHEIGHVLCFNHSGVNFNDEPRFSSAQQFDRNLLTPANEFSPFPTAVGDRFETGHEAILFTSDRSGGMGGLDLWIASFTDEGWVLTNIGPSVNSPADEVDPHLASDGSTLLFASNRNSEEKRFDLFQSSFDPVRETWSEAIPLASEINSPSNERHPSLTADMRTLYFSSDRPDGLGGADIWVAEWIVSEGFSRANNVGAPINTPADEQDPAISGDGIRLYFATNREGGRGGFDLWYSDLREGWKAPKNLDGEINTPANEIQPAVRLDNAFLTFSSDRPRGAGGYDIFVAAMIVEAPRSIPLIVPTVAFVLLILLAVAVISLLRRKLGVEG